MGREVEDGAAVDDGLWHPFKYGAFEFGPRKREGEGLMREWASRFNGFMQCQAVCNVLNDRERYRAALEKISSYKHAFNCTDNCTEIGCSLGRYASVVLKDD